MVEVVEPYTGTGADGTVASNGWLTKYTYNTLGNLTLVEQSPQYNQPVEQKRSFKYDALGRLTNQKLAERDATLDDAGNAGSTWSDFFSYDTRSNLIQRIDARRVKTNFTYNNDPLNRLQSFSYDKTPAINPSTIIDAANVNSYEYMSSGDLTQLYRVTMSDNVGNETYSYDVERRLNQRTQSFANIVPLLNTSYSWDTLSRLSQLTYPTQYGASGANKIAAYSYDLASRLSGATYASATIATVTAYNAASQALSLTLGNTLSESYTYDGQTGLLTNQSVNQGATKLVDLAYGYNDANSKKTGQLLSLTDNKNSHRSRAFSYDKLGRLSQVSGTSSGGAWQQDYSYDRYGNRLSVARGGAGASAVPLDAIDTGGQNSNTLTYTSGPNQPVSNRITTTNYTYDAAGNLIRGQAPDGSWQRYQYDSAGRLSKVTNDTVTQELASYSYGVSNQRLMASDNGGAVVTYYAWDGGQVIAEYTKSGISLVFQKSYVYLGGRLLATETADQNKQYHHPDRLGTRMVTDGNGTPISENVVLPFGTMLAAGTTLYGDNSYQSTTQSNPSKRFFTSYDRSQTTKLDYAVNRHYNAGQGRFTQVDPIGMSAVNLEDPQSLNLYAYCGNDPINRTDPDGLFFGWLKKLFHGIAKVLSVVFKVVAVLAAIAVILAVAWSVPAILGLALWKVALIAGAALVAAFASGKLAQIFGAVAGATAGGGGNFRTPSTFPNGTGVSGVSSFLQDGKKPTQEVSFWDWLTSDGIQAASNFFGGVGDTFTGGGTKEIRKWLGVDKEVDPCSGIYSAGGWSAIVVGYGRLGYAGAAKTLAVIGRSGTPTMVRALTVAQARNQLKVLFRAGMFRNKRIYSDAELIVHYKASPTAIIAAAGRTDTVINAGGGGLAVLGTINHIVIASPCPPPIKHEEVTDVAEVLLLNYYGGRKLYSLDTETGAIRKQVAPKHQNDILPAAGLGAFRTVGLFRHRHKIFIALYADQKTMLMRIGSRVFDLADPALRVKREPVAPYIKKFSVQRGDEEVLSLSYIYNDWWGTFPDEMGGDLFTFIRYVTSGAWQK